MPKEKFSWKGLFLTTGDEQEEQVTTSDKVEKSPMANKFPVQDAASAFTPPRPASVAGPAQVPPPAAATKAADLRSNPYLQEVLEIYEKGFESLNMPGFDFFEFYRSVMAVDLNPQSYQMAFMMGRTIQPDLTKEVLLEKAHYYIAEIEKVYKKYESAGNVKSIELHKKVQSEREGLLRQVSELEASIAALHTELAQRRAELERIENDKEQFTAIQLKIEANNYAKQRIMGSINTVLTGIKQYL